MEQFMAYGAMALLIAVLALIDRGRSRPVREDADRFGLAFLEAREYALGAAPPLPAAEKTEDGTRLLPQQAREVRAALERGGDSSFAARDAEMEQTLRDMFQHIGNSAHLKRHYYDYYNNLFALQRLFLRVCAQPDILLSQDDWTQLTLYWEHPGEVRRLAAERLSRPGRASLREEKA